MGEIKKILVTRDLPPRELHNSRLFVDLSENVHIHFRELRTVFSVPEFLEHADIISRSARDLKHFLRWHPQYREQENFGNVMVALGAEQQTRPLQKSLAPNQSTYFDDRLQIELQAENVIDEIHIHYRDYRLVMDRENFRALAHAMNEAVDTLAGFLADNAYERVEHPFRKEVVEDAYFESRSWQRLPNTGISGRDRLRAVAFKIGGERLQRLAGNAGRIAARGFRFGRQKNGRLERKKRL
jgi:hypothetical protein